MDWKTIHGVRKRCIDSVRSLRLACFRESHAHLRRLWPRMLLEAAPTRAMGLGGLKAFYTIPM